jgi:hypothetical protein
MAMSIPASSDVWRSLRPAALLALGVLTLVFQPWLISSLRAQTSGQTLSITAQGVSLHPSGVYLVTFLVTAATPNTFVPNCQLIEVSPVGRNAFAGVPQEYGTYQLLSTQQFRMTVVISPEILLASPGALDVRVTNTCTGGVVSAAQTVPISTAGLSTPTPIVPEPSSLWLFGSGLVALGWLIRRVERRSH